LRFEASLREIVCETLSKKNPTQKGLVKWLKVQALSSSPSTAKKEGLAASPVTTEISKCESYFNLVTTIVMKTPAISAGDKFSHYIIRSIAYF
jgi:hypothetical protein